MSSEPVASTPDVNEPTGRRRLMLRTAFFLFGLAVTYGGYQAFRSFMVDPDVGRFDSEGMLAAVESSEDGSRVVLFDKDGKQVFASRSQAGTSSDRDVVWRPDGNRVMFTSDREAGVFQVYRWNPAQDKVEPRTIGTTSKAHPVFGPPEYKMEQWTGLLVSGGFVKEFDPRRGTMKQILPPVVGAQQVDTEGGSGGQFETLYKSFGSSFREAKWGLNRESVVAVMRRDEGEILIWQSLKVQTDDRGNPSFAPPIPLVAGNQIEFDVDSKGRVVYSVVGFRWPDLAKVPKDFMVDNEIKTPYRNGVLVVNPEEQSAPISLFIDTEGKQALEKPVFNPFGDKILIRGSVRNEAGTFESRALLRIPIEEAGVSQAVAVAQGQIGEYAWSPNGTQIAYVVREKGKGNLFIVENDGTAKRQIGAGGDYSEPAFSPQLKP